MIQPISRLRFECGVQKPVLVRDVKSSLKTFQVNNKANSCLECFCNAWGTEFEALLKQLNQAICSPDLFEYSITIAKL